MLGKIIKYDIKATARYFIPMYIGLVIITLFNKLFIELVPFSSGNSLLSTLQYTFLTLYILFIIAAFIGNYVILVYHFYKNMTGDQAYLTFTLPVKTSSILNGKIITSAIWSLLSFIFMMLSFLIYPAGHGVMDFISEFMYELRIVMARVDNWGPVIYLIIILLLMCIISLFSSTLIFYASIAIGHLFGKYRVIGSIVSYIGLYIANQFLGVMGMFATGFLNSNNYDTLATLNRLMTVALLFCIVITGVYYFVTYYVFDKKLNLE